MTIVFKTTSNPSEVLEDIKKVATEAEGKVVGEKDLAQKKLAYLIKGNLDGHFYEVVVSGTEIVNKVSDLLRVNGEVLRYMITTVAEEPVKEVKS